jgi:hypothetical protein
MISEIYKKWHELGRPITTDVLNNCAAHTHLNPSKNTQLEFLSPNTTDVILEAIQENLLTSSSRDKEGSARI